MKKVCFVFAMLFWILVICSCRQNETTPEPDCVYSDPTFCETRGEDESVLIADVNRIWNGFFKPDDAGACYAVLECTVRCLVKDRSTQQIEEGNCLFLWLSLDHSEIEKAKTKELFEILETLQSVAVWGNPKTLVFGPGHGSYDMVRSEHEKTEQGSMIHIKPSIQIYPPIWSWRIIPITDGIVDATPVERLNEVIYDGGYTMYFDLNKPYPDCGMYFADGDTEEEFIAAIQKFENERDAEKEKEKSSAAEAALQRFRSNVLLFVLAIFTLTVPLIITRRARK